MFTLNRRFPFWIILGALVLYLVTSGRGVTINSLSLTAKVAGWDWTPMASQPLLWLLTLPLRLLPAAWVPLGLGLFTAAIAALTLGLLARTVQLLPWNQPWENENRQPGALPVLLACALCGLEFSFWQEATAGSGEMLDLLLLAAALWLLLEYRIRRESRWLNAATLVWGLGMAENWLMMLALPLFVAGVIWLQGLRFFQLKFLRRLAGLGLAGFSIYALLPLVNGLAPHSPWHFGEAWLVSLKQAKNLVVLLYRIFWMGHPLLAIAVVLYFMVPTLPCLIRLRDQVSSYKPMGEQLQLWVYRGLRVALLGVCLWLAFDPTAGLRQIIEQHSGIALPLLTFDYLNAIGAAFLLGDFLLLSRALIDLRCYSLTEVQWQQRALPLAAIACAVLLIAGLAMRNTPAILRLNFYPLQRFGELAVTALPAGRGVMLSDQPEKLVIFQAALAHHPNGLDWQAVDIRALPKVAYRAWLERRQPRGWLSDDNRHELTPVETMRMLENIARTNRLCYLHPSYGYIFERFYLEPTGSIYEMKLRGGDSAEIPNLPSAVTAANESFWTSAWEKELALLVPAPSRGPNGRQKYLLAEWYSISLDSWGVALQQQGRLKEAHLRFEQALQLNTNNFSALISLACNTNLQAGIKLNLAGADRLANEWGDFPHLIRFLNTGGPFDEPIFCYLLGTAFQKNGLPAQAARQLQRSLDLAPDTPALEFALADVYVQLRLTDRARRHIEHLRMTSSLSVGSDMDLELALLETGSWLLETNAANARAVLQSVWQRHPGNARVADRVVNAFRLFGDYTNALRVVEAQLAESPNNVSHLDQKAVLLLQSGNATAAIPVLTHILELTNMPEARLQRATGRLICLDEKGAENDFLELEKIGVALERVNYGLAMIAEHRHDTNQARLYLRACLTNTTSGSVLWRQADARLQELESGLPSSAQGKPLSSPNQK
jgi:tetratricopeptide (TPR) repeat protein